MVGAVRTAFVRENGMRRALVVGVVGAAFGVACTSSSPTSSEGAERHGSTRQQLAANIHPASIQIDGQAAGADLFRDAGTPLNAGATADWVVDALPNAGTSCLGADGIATCVEPNVTGATGGTGHWNGARIVDGIGGDDQDIFRTGGKENDTTTWNIGAGTVGSSKYDMVQAYLANNQTQLFFGMERRGNNGTTARLGGAAALVRSGLQLRRRRGEPRRHADHQRHLRVDLQ
jgi:hypothetical protein